MDSDWWDVFKSFAGVAATVLFVGFVFARVFHLGHGAGVGLLVVVSSYVLFATSWFGLFRRRRQK